VALTELLCQQRVADHKEYLLTEPLAFRLSESLGVIVSVIAGIHYDNITGKEIGTVERLAWELADEIVTNMKNK